MILLDDPTRLWGRTMLGTLLGSQCPVPLTCIIGPSAPAAWGPLPNPTPPFIPLLPILGWQVEGMGQDGLRATGQVHTT